MISTSLGPEAPDPAGAGGTVRGDPVPKLRCLAHEMTFGCFGVVPLVDPLTVLKKSHY